MSIPLYSLPLLIPAAQCERLIPLEVPLCEAAARRLALGEKLPGLSQLGNAIVLCNELLWAHESAHPADESLHLAAEQLKCWFLAQIEFRITGRHPIMKYSATAPQAPDESPSLMDAALGALQNPQPLDSDPLFKDTPCAAYRPELGSETTPTPHPHRHGQSSAPTPTPRSTSSHRSLLFGHPPQSLRSAQTPAANTATTDSIGQPQTASGASPAPLLRPSSELLQTLLLLPPSDRTAIQIAVEALCKSVRTLHLPTTVAPTSGAAPTPQETGEAAVCARALLREALKSMA